MSKLLKAFVLAATISAASSAHAQFGGMLYSNGGPVTVDIGPSDAGYTSELWLYSPGAPVFIGTNRDTGLSVNLGAFAPAQEMVFGLFVRDTGDTFLMGPGVRNADGLEHDFLQQIGPADYQVGFEDLFGGGDMDYNDCTFTFHNVVPAPGSIALAGLGALCLRRRR